MSGKIIIIAGDPNSINSEIIYKSWKKIKPFLKKKIYFIANCKLLSEQFEILGYPIKLAEVKNINETLDVNTLKVINVSVKYKDPFNVPEKEASSLVIKSLNFGHQLGLNRNVRGIINCAINKKLFKKRKTGVTEYLASKCNVKDDSEAMLIKSKHFSVSPITTHIDIKDISKAINTKMIIKKVKTIDLWLRKYFKRKPKIGILGLNPHNAELRKNSEECKIIIPSILKLKKLNINVQGPLVADTIFIDEYNDFDIIIGMYHDQVLIPFKALYKFDAMNITLGLRYLRLSPDHGVAADLIGKNKANATSLLKCINFVNTLPK
jgi:4-hydroxy-L-threonine phosphate dehydrogenase PdxA